MPEQANIRESFQLIMSRLRNFVDAPYVERPDIFGTEDNPQLFCFNGGASLDRKRIAALNARDYAGWLLQMKFTMANTIWHMANPMARMEAGKFFLSAA